MRPPLRVVASALALLLAACGGTAPPPSGDGGQAPLQGGLSEAGFAALHDLRADSPVAPRGTKVTLEGVFSNAYLSLPEHRTGPVPGVIVIHEWWGLNDHIRRWADRLAAEGYAALAVNLYDAPAVTDRDAAMAAVKAVKEDRARAVLAAAHRFLETSPEVRAPRTAVLGWCFGGGWALRTALDQDGIDAAVVYYGQPILDRDRLAGLRCPLLAIYGTRDASIPMEKVRALDETLTSLGKEHTVLTYDAEHAFANPSGTRYASGPAAEAWEQVRSFLAQRLR